MRDGSALPTTPAEVRAAVDVGHVTWPEVLRVLHDDLHMSEYAIEEWRSGDRHLGDVLVAYIEREMAE